MAHLLVTVTALTAVAVSSLSYAQGIDERIRNVDTLQRTTSRTVFGIENELLAVGAEALMAGRWEDGVRLTLLGLDQVGVTDAQRADGMSNLCGGYAALNRPDLAIDYCSQSIELNDENWRAWSNRSYAYWLKAQYDQAGQDLERAMSLNSNARQLAQIRGMLNEKGLRPRVEMEDRQ